MAEIEPKWNLIKTDNLNQFQKQELMNMWNNVYPGQLYYESLQSFEDYLSTLRHKRHFLIVDFLGRTMAWSMLFEREKEMWFLVMVNRVDQRKGLGKILLQEMQEECSDFYGWVIDENSYETIDGNIYVSPMPFYLGLGCEVLLTKTHLPNNIIASKIRFRKKRV